MHPEATVIDTDNSVVKSASIVIDAPAREIFTLLADPHRHHEFDGSGTVQPEVTGPTSLALGDRFTVSMRVGVPYRVTSTVKEFEPDRLIAWSHFGGHRWRYELRPVDESHTEVTETFDGTFGRFPAAYRLLGMAERNGAAIAATLGVLKRVVEASSV